MKNIKAHQRDRLILEFGVLVQPFDDLVQRHPAPNLDDYRIAIAKVQAGDNIWRRTVKEFTTFAQDVVFNEERREISHVPERFWGLIKKLITDTSLSRNLDEVHRRFTLKLENMKNKFLKFVNRVPFEWEPILFEANTPFTSYLRIRESIAIVNNRLHYFDRYLKEDFFHLFLNSLNSKISVRLVTTSGNENYGVNSVIHISNLARQQFNNYQLIEIEPKQLHDRNLRVDNQIFNLGPGVDRAGMALTNFDPSDSSEEAHKEFDNIIAKGNVVHQS